MQKVDNLNPIPWLMTVRDADGRSMWGNILLPSELRGGMLLSTRFGCTSLRMRESKPGYRTDWHVAGETVLIVVQEGILRIGLHGDEPRDFSAGDAFIVADKVPEGETFDPDRHGHTAEVVGEQTLRAIHIKLTEPLG
ncbi:MAG: hypothetical protein AAF085_05030 [Planctomycetota bacterium]